MTDINALFKIMRGIYGGRLVSKTMCCDRHRKYLTISNPPEMYELPAAVTLFAPYLQFHATTAYDI